MTTPTPTKCVNRVCGVEFAKTGRTRHRARGLCFSCYDYFQKAGQLDRFERLTLSVKDRLEDILMLRGEGMDLNQIAERMGVTKSCIQKVFDRSRAA